MEEQKQDQDLIEDTAKPNGGYTEMNIPFDMTQSNDSIAIAELTNYICNGINDGYSTFVVTHTIDHDLTTKDECQFDISKLNIAEKYGSFDSLYYKPDSLPIHKEFNIISEIDKIRIFTRLHVKVDNQKIAHQLMNSNGGGSNAKSSKILHTYDIISASTDNDKILDLLVNKSDVDIINFDLCEHLKFFFNKKLLRQAIDK